jgi:hypothetical protein
VNAPSWGVFNNGVSGAFENNVIINGGGVAARGSLSTSDNAYYGNSDPFESNPAIQNADAAAANNDAYCITIRGYTNPAEKCFSNAVSTSSSPHGTGIGFRGAN